MTSTETTSGPAQRGAHAAGAPAVRPRAGVIVVAEPDPHQAMNLMMAMQEDGHAVTWVRSGDAVLRLATRDGAGPGEVPDLFFLSASSHDEPIFNLVNQMRRGGYTGGIVVVTDHDSELERVANYDAGADHSLGRPLNLEELRGRVRSLLRRGSRPTAVSQAHRPTPSARPHRHAQLLRIDADRGRAYVGDTDLHLTPKEFALLQALMLSGATVATRASLMRHVWGTDEYVTANILDVTVRRLRVKLSIAGLGRMVVAVRGVGFRLEPPSIPPEPLLGP